MAAPMAIGLVESLPADAMIFADDYGRPLSILLQARQVEITHELIRVVLAALGMKRRNLPPPLRLLAEAKQPGADVRSPDPRAWSAALGASIKRVS